LDIEEIQAIAQNLKQLDTWLDFWVWRRHFL